MNSKRNWTGSLRNSRIFLRRLILTHMLILVISTIAVWAVGFMAINSTKSITKKSLDTQMNHLISELDGFLAEIYYMADGLSMNSEIYSTLINDAYHNVVQAEDILSTRKHLLPLSRPYFFDVSIFFPNSDRFVSNNQASLSTTEYIQTYYRGEGDEERILNALTIESNIQFIGLDNYHGTMAVFMPLPRSVTAGSMGKLMIILNPSIFQHIETLISDFSGSFQISTSRGEQLIAYGTSTDDDYIEINETSMYGLKLSVQLPNKHYQKQLSTFQWRLISVTGLYLIIGTSMALYLAKQTYKPIEHLTGLVATDDASVSQFRVDELEIIRQELTYGHLQKQRLGNLQEEHVFRQLLYSKPTKKVCHRKKAGQSTYVNLMNSSAMLILLELQASTEADLDDFLEAEPESESLLRTIVINIFNELLADDYECLYQQSSSLHFSILVLPNSLIETEKMRKDIEEKVSTFQTISRNELKFTFHAACELVPSVKDDLFKINASLASALKQAKIDDTALFLTLDDVPDQIPPYNFAFEKLLQLVRGSIQEDKPESSQIFAVLLDKILMGLPMHGELFAHLQMDLISLMRRLSSDYELESNTLSLLHDANTLKALESAFSHLVCELQDHYESRLKIQRATPQIVKICDRIDQYIEKEYKDPSLGLKDLEDLLQLSSSYISSLYSGYRGYSINDKINAIRITSAKQLLITTDLSVAEIATRCGFLYSTVFIRTFKRLEQMTPGVYRRVHN